MKKMVGLVSVLVVVLVLVASPGYAVSGVTGTANSDNTILNVQVGDTIVQLGTDLADSLNTSTLKSTGQFITGSVGDATLSGGAERTATKSSESGSESIGTGTKSVAGLASVTISSGTIANAISSTKTSSAVDFVLANLNALSGLTNIGTTSSSTDSVVGKSSSVVSRDVAIGDVGVLDLGTLLDLLGVNPLAIACAALESTGASLGVDTSTACSALDGISDPGTGALPVGLSDIDDTETILGTLETALGLICIGPLSAACDSVTPLITAATGGIDAVQADPGSTCATVLDQLATVSTDLSAVLDELDVLNGTGGLLDGLLDALISPVTSQADVLGTATSTLDTACNTLLGIVQSLLDTPLLSLDLIDVAMDLVADTSPTSSVSGSIGSLKVGNLTVVDESDLLALGSQLNAAIDDVELALAGVLDALDLGLSAPVIDLLKVTKDAGKNASGLYFAEGALSVAHIGLPAGTVNLPAGSPLDVLGGLGSFTSLSGTATALDTPEVAVDAGVFSGQATFKAASNASSSDESGDLLPNTGVADSGMAFTGMLFLIGAAVIRRVLGVR